MFFMTKSVICIGVVAVVATGSAGGGTVRTTLESGGREAAASLGRVCAASRDCVGLGTRIAAAAIGRPDMVSDAIARAGAARAGEALAAPESLIRSAPASAAERPPRPVERRIRRSVTAQD